MAAWQGAKIGVPAKLIVGTKDMGYRSGGTKEYIESSVFKSLVPNHEIVILDAHHFIHLERADQVSQEILSFILKLSWLVNKTMSTLKNQAGKK